MRKLALLRHAKAETMAKSGRDFDRSLDPRGRADAAAMGRELTRLGLSFDREVSSTARRAMETAQLAGLRPSPDPHIYEASTGELLAIVQATSETTESLLLVGHNPGFERLASWLTGEQVIMPTGSLVQMELPIEGWQAAVAGSARLALFLKARDRA